LFRLQEIYKLLDIWLSRKSATKKTYVDFFIGTLQFASKCVPFSKIFIPCLVSVLPSLKQQYHYFHLLEKLKKDLF